MFLHTSWPALQIWASKTAQTNSMLQYSEKVFSSYDITSPTPWPLSAVQSRMLELGSQKNRGLGLREKFFATNRDAAEVFSLPFSSTVGTMVLSALSWSSWRSGACQWPLRQVTCLNLELKKWRPRHLTSCVLQTSSKHLSFFVSLPNQTWFCAADAPVLFLWDFLLLKIYFESKKSNCIDNAIMIIL